MTNTILKDIEVGDELFVVATQEKVKVVKIIGTTVYYQDSNSGKYVSAEIIERS